MLFRSERNFDFNALISLLIIGLLYTKVSRLEIPMGSGVSLHFFSSIMVSAVILTIAGLCLFPISQPILNVEVITVLLDLYAWLKFSAVSLAVNILVFCFSQIIFSPLDSMNKLVSFKQM